jgi:hypothetical protein
MRLRFNLQWVAGRDLFAWLILVTSVLAFAPVQAQLTTVAVGVGVGEG